MKLLKKTLLILLTVIILFGVENINITSAEDDGELRLDLIAESMSTDGITLSWNAVAADEYEVSRNGSPVQKASVTCFTDNVGKTMGTEYRYVVKAIKDGECLAVSEEAVVTYNPFGDVDDETDDFAHVAWAYNNGIVGGKKADTGDVFKLGGLCTRAQFCIMLYKMNGNPAVSLNDLPFSDIDDQTKNTKKAIVWCYNQGIVSGKDGKFNPKGKIKRSQLIIMLYKMAGTPDYSGMSCPLTDLDGLTSNTKKAIIWAYNFGVDQGTDETHFSPDEYGTRGQLTAMLHNYELWYHLVDPQAPDTRAPLIYLLHDSEEIVKGQTIDLLPYAVVVDDLDDHIILKMEGEFDYKTVGTYPVKFVAVDASGNRSEASFTLKVVNSESQLTPVYPHHSKGFDYKLVVNIHNQTVRVYRWDGKDYNDLLKIFTCSTGTSTPKRIGTWKTPEKYRWKWLFGNVYGQYATRIKDTCLFHSVPYFTKKPNDLEYLEYNKLGTACSMGCVRLRVIDVKWIYDNCPTGTTVVIKDDDTDAIPVQWLAQIDVNSPNRGWDPTDPDENNPWHN